MKTKITFILWAVLLPLLTWGQVSFRATCDEKEVVVGQRFEVSFKLKGTKALDFEPPTFTGFQVLATSNGYSTSFVNGKASMISSINYTLLATRKGKFKIAKAKVITAEKKVLYSNVLKIKVLEAGQAPQNTNSLASQLAGKVFIRTEVSNTKPVVGEQLLVDIKLYFQINLEGVEIVKQPTFSDFFSYPIESYDGPKKEAFIKGKRYTTKVIRRIAVFPSKAGTMVIEPAMVDVGVSVSGQQSLFNPFFQVAKHTLTSMPIEVEVKALENVPSDFSGLVGSFDMNVKVEKNTIQSDDVIQLRIKLLGAGDIKQLLAPKLGVNQKYFDEFEPNSDSELRVVDGLLAGIKVFDYVLTPKVVGDFEINPSFVYFDANQNKFIRLDTIIKIRIEQGEGAIKLPTTTLLDSLEKTEKKATLISAEDLLEYNMPQNTATFKPLGRSFLATPLFGLLLFLPVLALGVVFYRKQKLEKIAAIPQEELAKQNAASLATQRLKSAKKIMSSGDSKAFYSEISKALLGFVADKYNIATMDLTKNNVKQVLIKQEIASDKISNLMTILQTCEMALFAGMVDKNAMQKVYKDSEELMKLMS